MKTHGRKTNRVINNKWKKYDETHKTIHFMSNVELEKILDYSRKTAVQTRPIYLKKQCFSGTFLLICTSRQFFDAGPYRPRYKPIAGF